MQFDGVVGMAEDVPGSAKGNRGAAIEFQQRKHAGRCADFERGALFRPFGGNEPLFLPACGDGLHTADRPHQIDHHRQIIGAHGWRGKMRRCRARFRDATISVQLVGVEFVGRLSKTTS